MFFDLENRNSEIMHQIVKDTSLSADTENCGNTKNLECDSGDSLKWIPLNLIRPNPKQPRKVFDEIKLIELAQSIKTSGILQPILVRWHGKDYEIISGERRYQAAKRVGLNQIPAFVRTFDEKESRVAALIENIQREDLNPVEEAKALREILQKQELTHDQLADLLGKSRSALTNRLRILNLNEDIQNLISSGKLSSGHAKMLAGLKTSEEAHWWARKILAENLSVYETEKQISFEKLEKSKKTGLKNRKTMSDIHTRVVEDRLGEKLGAKVKIRQGRSKGIIEIEFYGRDDLERVIENLLPQEM